MMCDKVTARLQSAPWPPHQQPVEFASTDEQLAEMVAVADLPSLLGHARPRLRAPAVARAMTCTSIPTKHHEPQGGWTPDQQAHARELALRTLAELRDAGWPAAPKPTAESVRPIIRWMTATETSDDYVALLLEELGRRGPTRTVVGAPRPSHPIDRFASQSSVPACRACSPRIACDKPASRSSSSRRTPMSVARGWRTHTRGAVSMSPATCSATRSPSAPDWPQHFSTQPELLDYFQRFADESGVRAVHPLLDDGRVGGVRRRCGDVARVHRRRRGGAPTPNRSTPSSMRRAS